MLIRGFASCALSLALVAGCNGQITGGGDGGVGGDAGPDAQPGSCFADLIDLDDPATGQHMGNQVTFSGTIRGGNGDVTPAAGDCVTGPTRNEKAHKITATGGRLRLRASTINMTTTMNTVVYVRTDCMSDATEIACNDDAGGTIQSAVEIIDVPTDVPLYIVVDGAQNQPVALPQSYQLVVSLDPVVAEGGACDPTLVDNACEPGTVCSVASGSPLCATPIGPPTVDSGSGAVLTNGHTVTMSFTASDPDGDIQRAYGTFLDRYGSPIDLAGNTLSAIEYELTPVLTPALPGNLTVNESMSIRAFVEAPKFFFVRVRVVDSLGDSSDPFDVPLQVDWVGPGAACGTDPQVKCNGELACTASTCTEPSTSAAACTAIAAGVAVSAPGTYQVTVPSTGDDLFQGSCFWDPGLPEAVLKVSINGPRGVRLSADTQATAADTYVYIRAACNDPSSELACNDNVATTGASFASARVPIGTYYVFVDQASAGASGDIAVALTMTDLRNPFEACSTALDECVRGYICWDPAGGTSATCLPEDTVFGQFCAEGPALVAGESVTGSIPLTGRSFVEPSCRFAGGFPEAFHTLTLTTKADVTLTTAGVMTNVDTVVAIFENCSAAAAEWACNDDIDLALPNWRSNLGATLGPGTYAIVVDISSPSAPDGGAMAPDPAQYQLSVEVRPVLDTGASCDPAEVDNRCDWGLTCSGTPPTCQ